MTGSIASRWVGDFLFGFGALFAIINPYGLAFVFLERTMSLSERERASIALRVALYAFAVLVVSLFLGSQILRFFGISMPALRIAGGLVVAVAGWSMLHATPVASERHAASTVDFAAIQKMASISSIRQVFPALIRFPATRPADQMPWAVKAEPYSN